LINFDIIQKLVNSIRSVSLLEQFFRKKCLAFPYFLKIQFVHTIDTIRFFECNAVQKFYASFENRVG